MSQPINKGPSNLIHIPTVPFPQGEQLGLKDLTASYVVTNNIHNLPNSGMCSYDTGSTNRVLKDKWDNIKCDASKTLKDTMKDIEISIFQEIDDSILIHNILKEEECLMWAFHDVIEKGDENLLKTTIQKFLPVIAAEDRDFLLEERVNLLFQKLAEKVQTEAVFGDIIPVNLKSYAHSQQKFDDALRVLWANILPKLGNAAPVLNTPNEIRTWLTNAGHLDQVTSWILNRRTKGVDVIPPELTHLTNLQDIILSNGQIKIIPKCLGGLLNLVKLDLSHNEIKTIPECLGNLPNLRKLDLAYNQIEFIPKNLGCSNQLKEFNLSKNKITILNNILQLKQVDLKGNPLLFCSDLERPNVFQCFIASRFTDFMNYKCNSEFSQFYRLATLSSLDFTYADTETIKNNFEQLNANTQAWIIVEVAYYPGFPFAKNLELAKQHLFDDMNLFFKALRKTVSSKFSSLFYDDLDKVYEEIYNLAGRPPIDTDAISWGEEHAFENVLRLIDAMNQIDTTDPIDS